MPIYEYECPSCGVVEVTQRITEAPLSKCPQCKRRKVKKLISSTSFQLKGSGWYVTDYGGKKSDSSSDSSTSSSDSKSTSESKSTSKTESSSTGSTEKKASGKKEGGKKDGKAAA